MNKNIKLAIIPVMLSFFAMGFVDMVGIASNYVKEDLCLTEDRPVVTHRNGSIITSPYLRRELCTDAHLFLTIRNR